MKAAFFFVVIIIIFNLKKKQRLVHNSNILISLGIDKRREILIFSK